MANNVAKETTLSPHTHYYGYPRLEPVSGMDRDSLLLEVQEFLTQDVEGTELDPSEWLFTDRWLRARSARAVLRVSEGDETEERGMPLFGGHVITEIFDGPPFHILVPSEMVEPYSEDRYWEIVDNP